MRCGNRVILAPLWGSRFVSIDTDTGVVQPFETEINLSYPEDQSYCLSGGAGGFIRMLDEAHALFYDEPERKLYRMNLHDGSVEDVSYTFELSEVAAHAPGYAKGSQWVRYGCEERATASLPQLLDGTGAGASFDRAACLEAYGEIAQYAADGSSGKMIHEMMLQTLEDIDEK